MLLPRSKETRFKMEVATTATMNAILSYTKPMPNVIGEGGNSNQNG